MAPKRKANSSAPPPAIPPRKTRSATAGKRTDPPAEAPVRAASKKVKLSSNENAKRANGAKVKADDAKTMDKASDAQEAPVASPPDAAVGSSKTVIIEACHDGDALRYARKNMPRPFAPMKKLDMDEVIEDIIKKIA